MLHACHKNRDENHTGDYTDDGSAHSNIGGHAGGHFRFVLFSN